jgi:hypothetical protein
MSRSYYEDLYRSERRAAEWRMLNTALSTRRGHAFPRGLIAAIFWIFGIR